MFSKDKAIFPFSNFLLVINNFVGFSLIRLTSTYKLVIFDDTHQRLHSVNFPGSKTLAEIKRDVFDLTNIAVRHQFWTGWPPALTDDVKTNKNNFNETINNSFLFVYFFRRFWGRQEFSQFSI